MDYKTNILKHEAKVEEPVLAEVSGLLFGSIDTDKIVFDYTAYFEKNDIEPIDYKLFMRINKWYIDMMCKYKEIKTSELFYQNTNGHILVAVELAFIFLAFCNVEMFIYFNGLISDVITTGVAYSDGFIYSAASERLPTDVLAEIIKKRIPNEEGSEQ